MRRVVLMVVLPLVLSLAGCASANTPAVAHVVANFYTALQEGDGATACRLMVPATRSAVSQASGMPCAKGILSEKLPRPGAVDRVAIYGDQAQVRLAHDTAFMAEFPSGWRVVAVGCKPRRQAPYQCEADTG